MRDEINTSKTYKATIIWVVRSCIRCVPFEKLQLPSATTFVISFNKMFGFFGEKVQKNNLLHYLIETNNILGNSRNKRSETAFQF